MNLTVHGLVALLLGGILVECAQTDVIARQRQAVCVGAAGCAVASAEAGAENAQCRAAPCADFEAIEARCGDATPHLSLGDGCSSSTDRLPTFRFALCSCTDYVSNHALATSSWNSSDPTAAGSLTASVATNGAFVARGTLSLAGALVVGGAATLDANASQMLMGTLTEHAPPACACDPGALLDVADFVAAHAADNDNQKLGFDPHLLDGFNLPANAPALELGCGRYYFASVHGQGALHLHVTGHAVLFIAGDFALDNDFALELAPSASADVFIAGNLRAGGRVTLGNASTAPNVRLYVGGAGTLDVAGEAVIAGLVYAPHAELVTRDTLTTYGSLFVRRAAPLGDVTLHYDVAEQETGRCVLPPRL